MELIQVVDKNYFPPLTTRRNHRIVAFLYCFQFILTKEKVNSFLKKTFENNYYIFENTFAWKIIQGVAKNKDFLKQVIQKYLKKQWLFDRLDFVDQACLLIATFEILFIKTNNKIVIN